MKVALPARAKLNLDLQVIKRRADGFHEIRTHMQSVALHDLLQAEPASNTALEIDGLSVPQGADNIVLKAHAALEHVVGRELPTHFRLHKGIPPGAGLGGASSDAAAALRALKFVHGLETDITKIAHSVGADVPFFVAGGCALAEGTGERLSPLPTEHAWYAIAWPHIELSTATVYGAWDEIRGEPPNELLQAAGRADLRVREFADRLGRDWQMTGSGSAFFRRCADEEVALKAIASLDCWTTVTHSVGVWA
ncbi:MAG: 4-(cytidine 5'-diphospho)-2-C-methyl-D-erythritol kinase [Chloroflexi bacterium]|nr:MAG: 4-(cytidine 5'-diphospho)-2-C-methyl-D-erythritol kinase [Chloroflexota bacterium]